MGPIRAAGKEEIRDIHCMGPIQAAGKEVVSDTTGADTSCRQRDQGLSLGSIRAAGKEEIRDIAWGRYELQAKRSRTLTAADTRCRQR